MLLLAGLPLVIFAILAVLFAKQLLSDGSPRDIPSALIGKPAPQLQLAALEGLTGSDGNQLPGFDTETLRGKVSIVNVWASWCAPCRVEHPVIMQLASDKRIQVTGLNYKDNRENALRFLGQLGNPFSVVGVDPRGKAAIDWGVYGVPETFIVGADGNIVHKHVGPLGPQSLEKSFMPALEKALADAES
jgi:cytochrome c biogenesis protein CcmG/thiol:disulfide interchange protein DsbE